MDRPEAVRDERADEEPTDPPHLYRRVVRMRNDESFASRWLGNAVKFADEFSTFFVMLSVVAVPLAVALSEVTLVLQTRTVTLWHVVAPSALTLTGAAWCWSV